jgi:hypothetical protein
MEELHTMKLPGVEAYRNTVFSKIPGWMHTLDLEVFDSILGHQLDAGIRGDILEIGSFHGKSAIVCGYGLRPNETLTVCDIFGDISDVPLEGTDPYDGLTVDLFLEQYGRFHTKQPDVRSMPSSRLKLDRDYRFIHIDGGHAYEVVRDDIHLCVQYATADCVIALDDFRTSHTPGVSAAVWEATYKGILYPFLLTETKLYAAVTPGSQRVWADVARDFGFPSEEHVIHSERIVRVWR